MFNSLSDRLTATFRSLKGKGRLSEADIRSARDGELDAVARLTRQIIDSRGRLSDAQLQAARDAGLIEVFFMKRPACLWGERIAVDAHGHVAVPQGPGLGYEPDRDVMEKYRVA